MKGQVESGGRVSVYIGFVCERQSFNIQQIFVSVGFSYIDPRS